MSFHRRLFWQPRIRFISYLTIGVTHDLTLILYPQASKRGNSSVKAQPALWALENSDISTDGNFRRQWWQAFLRLMLQTAVLNLLSDNPTGFDSVYQWLITESHIIEYGYLVGCEVNKRGFVWILCDDQIQYDSALNPSPCIQHLVPTTWKYTVSTVQ